MEFFKLMHRALAFVLLIAMLVSLVPNVFAAEQDVDEIDINIPEELKDEDIVTATFG